MVPAMGVDPNACVICRFVGQEWFLRATLPLLDVFDRMAAARAVAHSCGSVTPSANALSARLSALDRWRCSFSDPLRLMAFMAFMAFMPRFIAFMAFVAVPCSMVAGIVNAIRRVCTA